MRKTELFARFRRLCEVHKRNKLRRMYIGLRLLSDEDIIDACSRHDVPGDRCWSTDVVDWVKACSHPCATARDFRTAFKEIWKVRECALFWRREQGNTWQEY